MPLTSCENETIATLHLNRSGQPRSSQWTLLDGGDF